MHADLADDGERDEHAHLREKVRGDGARVVQGGEHVAGDADRESQAHEAELEEAARPRGGDRDGCHQDSPPLCAPDCGLPDWAPDWAPDCSAEGAGVTAERLRPAM